MKAIKLCTKIGGNNLPKVKFANFGDKFREKELAEEKIYFDKQESKYLIK